VPRREWRRSLARPLLQAMPLLGSCYNRKGPFPFMPLRLFNTLTGQIDTLVPEGGPALRMYACGPTVYDYGHIGNFRTFLQIDVLRRTLLLLGIPLQAPDQPATVIEVECDAEPVIDHETPRAHWPRYKVGVS